MDRHIERWKKMIADNTRAAEMLESGEMRTYTGPGSGPESDTSAADAKMLRDINRMLQDLVNRRMESDFH